MATLAHPPQYAAEVSSVSSTSRMRPSSGSSCPGASAQPSIKTNSPSLSVDDLSVASSHASSTSVRPGASSTGRRAGSRRCGFPECQKTAKRGGLCISHGGGKKCSVDGCNTSVVSRGCCVAHGGGKRCQAAACTKSAQTGGFCWIHGGGKKCGVLGCKKRAQSGGACISHGGGKRCRTEGCNKVVQYDGLCVGHGGYRKCLSANCSKRALANSYCQAHGGNSVCLVANCSKRAVRGGICTEHKAQMPHRTATASRKLAPSRPSIDALDDQETKFKPEPRSWALSGQEQRQWPNLHVPATASSKSSPELRAPTAYTPVITQADERSRFPHSRGERVVSPLQYVRGHSFGLADEDSPLITPISHRFESTDHGRNWKDQKYPILPGIQTLQSHRGSSTWDERSGMAWSSPSDLQAQLRSLRTDDAAGGHTATPTPMDVWVGDSDVPSEVLPARLCSVASCGRSANRNGMCLLHSAVPASGRNETPQGWQTY